MIVTYVNLKEDIISTDNKYFDKLNEILKHVAEFTGVSIYQMKLKNNKKEYVDARYIYLSYAREITKFGMYDIANKIMRTHSLVIGARKRISNKFDLQNYYNEFKEYIKYINL